MNEAGLYHLNCIRNATFSTAIMVVQPKNGLPQLVNTIDISKGEHLAPGFPRNGPHTHTVCVTSRRLITGLFALPQFDTNLRTGDRPARLSKRRDRHGTRDSYSRSLGVRIRGPHTSSSDECTFA